MKRGCDSCKGTGVYLRTCPDCDGYPSKTSEGNCDTCHNEGFVEEECPDCDGLGHIKTENDKDMEE